MKNKSKSIVYIILITCFVNLFSYAQSNNKSKSTPFNLKVIEYSQKADSEKVHYHLLSLENNSNKEDSFNLSAKTFEVVNKTENNNYNVTVELYSEDLTKRLSKVLLQPKKSIKFIVKTSQNFNAKLGSRNHSKIIAHSINSNEKKSLNINSYIPNPNVSGR